MTSNFCPHCGVARGHGLYCTSCGQRYEERTQPTSHVEPVVVPSDVHIEERAQPNLFQRVIKFSGYLFMLALIAFMFAIGAGSIMIWSIVLGAVVTFLWMLTIRR